MDRTQDCGSCNAGSIPAESTKFYMYANILIFAVSLFLIVRGATMATKYSAKLAENFRLSKYIVGFIIVTFISILPETLISINSALAGIPSFGLGTLFGSNVADLTLIFAILIISAGRGIKIESSILKDIHYYPFFLLLPIALGLDGKFSRAEGLALIIIGLIFYWLVFKNCARRPNAGSHDENGNGHWKNFFQLLFALAILLIGSYFTVMSAVALANFLAITPIIIGLLVVGLGTTMPELFFSLKSLDRRGDGLAVGDILGTVMADATIVVGLLALISPFSFPVKIIYSTGMFMVAAALLLCGFMRSDRILSKKEGYLLLLFWLAFVFTEFFLNK